MPGPWRARILRKVDALAAAHACGLTPDEDAGTEDLLHAFAEAPGESCMLDETTKTDGTWHWPERD